VPWPFCCRSLGHFVVGVIANKSFNGIPTFEEIQVLAGINTTDHDAHVPQSHF